MNKCKINELYKALNNVKHIKLNKLKNATEEYILSMSSQNEIENINSDILSKLQDTTQNENKHKQKSTKKDTPEFDKLPKYVPGQKTMVYAGIGSRETPIDIMQKMNEISKWLEAKGYLLNSGNANGADKAFEGIGMKYDIATGLPVRNKQVNGKWVSTDKNGNIIPASNIKFYKPKHKVNNKNIFTAKDANDKVRTIAKEIHPAGSKLSGYALDLHARNTFQIFGKNLDKPVDFVIFYTEESDNPLQPKGGTGQAIEMARRKGIPTVNMMDTNWKEQMRKILELNANDSKKTIQSDTINNKISDKIIKYPKYYKGNIKPNKNTIFVFGSNPEGRHGKGAALIAKEQFDAIYGKGEGLQGNAYALPTKDLKIKENNGYKSIKSEQIIKSIKKLYEIAKENPNKLFKIAYRNTNKYSLNGYTGYEMIDMFNKAGDIPNNIIPSKEWYDTNKWNINSNEQTKLINNNTDKIKNSLNSGAMYDVKNMSIKELEQLKIQNDRYIKNHNILIHKSNQFRWDNSIIEIDKNEANEANYQVFLAHEIIHDKTANWIASHMNDKDIKYLQKAINNVLEDIGKSINKITPEKMLLWDRLNHGNEGMERVQENVAVLAAEPDIRKALLNLYEDKQGILVKILNKIKTLFSKEEKINAQKILNTVKNIERKAINNQYNKKFNKNLLNKKNNKDIIESKEIDKTTLNMPIDVAKKFNKFLKTGICKG